MHTLLSRFCDEFVRVLRPLQTPLSRAAEVISGAPDGTLDKKIQVQLLELRQQIELLSKKVEDQQAYVLIFGPLKSGKSTLMNAISGSYVSEVSSLPAYPCMVFVSHGEKREYTITRYNAQQQTFDQPKDLSRHVDRAHQDLAAKIRAAESEGKDFDPRADFKDAISKIDVQLPTPGLSQSSAVLVDTPGLYSRMKFGYDRMTRDFRNAAACAVFVVRSDNLFLEQVFAEFTDLLELFSRIFLVVNVDSRKLDLDPNGKLVPSLEQQDPQRIIDAFESLAMSAPLKKAADQGRLKIYPIDLLDSASRRLERASNANGSSTNTNKQGSAAPSGFDKFFGDLTEYLNSTDHLVAFLGDSLRRASTLMKEASELCGHVAIKKLHDKAGGLDRELASTNAVFESVQRLAAFPWAEHLEKLGQQLAKSSEALAADAGEKASGRIADAIRKWFRSNDSLQKLVKKELVPAFTRYQEELSSAVSKELSERLVRTGLGIELPANIDSALQQAQLDVVEIGREAHRRTDRRALVRVPPTPLRSENFHVRRNLWDVLTFRGQAALQRRLFGPAEAPAQSISVELKSNRLGDAGRSDAQRRLETYKRQFFAETVDRVVSGFAQGYCKQVVGEIDSNLRAQVLALEARVAELTAERDLCRQLLEPLGELATNVDKTAAEIEKLTTHYGQVDLFLLTQPTLADHAIPSKAPAAAAPDAGDVKPKSAPRQKS